MINIQAKRESLGSLANRIHEMASKIDAENRYFDAGEQENWQKLNGDYETLKAQIDALAQAEKITREAREASTTSLEIRSDYDGAKARKKLAKEERRDLRMKKREKKLLRQQGWMAAGITEEERCLALQAWVRRQMGLGIKWYQEEAAAKCGINPRQRYLDLNLTPNYNDVLKMEQRALALAPNTAGGYTVPEGFVQNLEIALLAYAQMRRTSDVMRTASGQDLPWPTVNDTTNKGAILVENATVTPQDTIFGQMVLHAWKYTSKLVLVPVDLMEDSAFNLAATLGELLGIRIGRIQADHFTFGTGAAQPMGIITASVLGRTATSSTAISTDDLYNLKHSVDPAYREQPGVGWMMHDQVLLAIKLLKDTLGRPLWQASLAGGRPDTIDNDPVFINQSMASSVASGNKTVLYGALKKYKIRDVSQIRLRRLVERYADADQEGFVMFMRGDGNLIDAGTHPCKYIQN